MTEEHVPDQQDVYESPMLTIIGPVDAKTFGNAGSRGDGMASKKK